MTLEEGVLRMFASKLYASFKKSSHQMTYLFLLTLWTLAIYLSTQDTSRALAASADLWVNQRWKSLLNEESPAIEQQRAIQQHYLSYGVYIPIDDIVVDARQQLSEPVRAVLQAACGKGRAFVWVPLPVHLPVFGEKVFEWCLVKA